jgi:tetratricopeptide (TPR) repeat protein
MTRRTPLVLATALALLAVRVGAQKPRKNINDASVAAVRTWVEAVQTHTPGRSDAAVSTVAAFSYETREDLNTGINLFFAALLGGTYDTDNNKAAEIIVEIGHGVGRDFLKRGAVLHADVAAYVERHPLHETVAPKSPGARGQELQIHRGAAPERLPGSEPVPPLLVADRLLVHKDGEAIGERLSTWNWPFARSLLDLLGVTSGKSFLRGRVQVATDAFVSTWYHATTAYMFAEGLYGEATSHLHHASMVLPQDALSLFDRGCYAEILGLPMHQALIPEPDVGQRARGAGSLPWTTPGAGDEVRIPAEATTNADAERLFRRALAVDPSLVEARVRLARLLDLRGRHDEAAKELNTALSQNPSGALAYYAHLFSARAAQAAGDIKGASHHYDDALRLFPHAQSALLGSSQISLVRANVADAVPFVDRLSARSAVFTADPWWEYHLAAGREATELLETLWAMTPTDSRR